MKCSSVKANYSLPQHWQLDDSTSTTHVSANQLPPMSDAATTGHKSQGSSLDAAHVPDWNYSVNWPYVVISRVRTLQGLFVGKKLDPSKDHSVPVELQRPMRFFHSHKKPASFDATLLNLKFNWFLILVHLLLWHVVWFATRLMHSDKIMTDSLPVVSCRKDCSVGQTICHCVPVALDSLIPCICHVCRPPTSVNIASNNGEVVCPTHPQFRAVARTKASSHKIFRTPMDSPTEITSKNLSLLIFAKIDSWTNVLPGELTQLVPRTHCGSHLCFQHPN